MGNAGEDRRLMNERRRRWLRRVGYAVGMVLFVVIAAVVLANRKRAHY
jgi:hypothetical protein